MFRRIKTVASIMESFRTAIDDLNEIVVVNIAINDGLHAQRNKIDAKIEDVDLEIHQAQGTRNRMSDLVFGPPIPGHKCGEGCTE